MGVLADAERELEAADVASCDVAALRELARVAARAERCLAGHKARIAAAALDRDRSGSGPAAHDTLTAGGIVSLRAAKAQADQTEILSLLPEVSEAAASGGAHPENIATLAASMRGLTTEEKAALARHDRGLAERAKDTRPDEYTNIVKDRIQQIRGAAADTLLERQRAASELAIRSRRDGMYGINGSLDRERGQAAAERIDAVARELAGDGSVTANHRAAAFHLLVTGSTDGVPAPRLGIGTIVDHGTATTGERHEGTVCETWGGAPVDVRDLGRLMCDADLWHLHLDPAGRPVWVTSESRTATRDQRLALRALYRTCPIDGVTPFAACEVHHIVPIGHGGETRLDQMAPVSYEWHHKLHDHHWRLEIDPDRTLRLYRPDGTLDRVIPPPTPITRHGP